MHESILFLDVPNAGKGEGKHREGNRPTCKVGEVNLLHFGNAQPEKSIQDNTAHNAMEH
jgi:hypothetical protein